MKKFGKKGMAVVLSLLMILLTACGGNESETGKAETDTKDTGEGRYVEEEYALPESSQMVYAMNTLSDGTIRVVAESGVYDSTDGGQTFTKSDISDGIYEQLSNDGQWVSAAGIGKEGNMLLAIFMEDGTSYYYIDKNGEQQTLEIDLPESVMGGLMGSSKMTAESDSGKIQGGATFESSSDGTAPEVSGGEILEGELPEGEDAVTVNGEFSNSLAAITFSDEGKMVGKDVMGGLYVIDPSSGEILQTLTEQNTGEMVDAFACVGEKLVASTGNGVDIYDLATGELLESEEALNSYFTPTDQEEAGEGMVVSIGGTSELVFASGNQEGEFYFVDETGLYRYVLGSSAVEEIMNGSLYSMADPGYYYNNLIAKEDGSFLIAYQEMSENSLNTKLMNYVYDAEASAVPSKEITIYTLEDNQNIRQAISQFQKSHPDCYVNLEVGMSGKDATTVSDALKSLNTDILAGNGPDILLLDGMPVDSYIDKGLLYDLSETVDTAVSEHTFFEQVLYANKTGAGIYAVPTRFSIPMLAGAADQLQTITDLASLAEATTKLRQENQEIDSILGKYTGEQMVELLYHISSVSMIQEDGTLNEDKLTEFLTLAKGIYDKNGEGSSDTEEAHAKGMGMAEDTLRNLTTIVSNKQLLEVKEMGSISDFNTLISVNKEVDWAYQLMAGQTESVFTPLDTVGVSAKSEDIETSLEFVKDLLSSDMQKISQSTGFPINMVSFDELCQEQLETEDKTMSTMIGIANEEGGDMVQLEIKSGTEEDYAQLKEYLKAVNTPANTNDIIQAAVQKEASDCMEGVTTIEEATANIVQTVNLYLAE